MRHSSLDYKDIKVVQKHVMLAIIFCIQLCDVKIGLIFKYFVICQTSVLGDDFISGNLGKVVKYVQEGANLQRPITLDFFMIILN
jgi:hypothetical protein